MKTMAGSRFILLTVVLLCAIASRNGITSAFIPTAGNIQRSYSDFPSLSGSSLAKSTFHTIRSSSPTPLHQSQLYRYSSRAVTQNTELEILEIKRAVLSIVSERDDEIRRSYVSKWITNQATKINYEEGARLILLWDTTVIQLGDEFQQRLRSNVRRKARPCSVQTYSKDTEEENKLILWAFVDMLIQSKTLIKKLGVPKQSNNGPRLHYQRIQHKLKSTVEESDNEDSIFQ